MHRKLRIPRNVKPMLPSTYLEKVFNEVTGNSKFGKFALTISPRDRTDVVSKFKDPNRLIYNMDADYIRKVFKIANLKDYIIYPEFAEGRLHYHGILTLSYHDHVTWYRSTLKRLTRIGFVDLKVLISMRDTIRWSLYMRKEWYITHNILCLPVGTPPLLAKKAMNPDFKKPKANIPFAPREDNLEVQTKWSEWMPYISKLPV